MVFYTDYISLHVLADGVSVADSSDPCNQHARLRTVGDKPHKGAFKKENCRSGMYTFIHCCNTNGKDDNI